MPNANNQSRRLYMAKNLTAQVAGGDPQAGKSASTVGELAAQVGAEGYVATVNGELADSNQSLNDYEFVAFAKPVKAG
jgi:hypothetical protein